MSLHYCDGCESIKQDELVTEDTCEHCGHWTVVAPVEDGELDILVLHWASEFNASVVEAWERYQS